MRAARAAFLFGPPFLFQALIYFLSSRQLPSGPEGSDKVLHFCAYGFLALLWIRALSGGTFAPAPGWAVVAVAIATLFGLSDEYHQSFVPGRTASGFDLLADALGAAAAAAVCLVRAARGREEGSARGL